MKSMKKVTFLIYNFFCVLTNPSAGIFPNNKVNDTVHIENPHSNSNRYKSNTGSFHFSSLQVHVHYYRIQSFLGNFVLMAPKQCYKYIKPFSFLFKYFIIIFILRMNALSNAELIQSIQNYFQIKSHCSKMSVHFNRKF